MGLLAALGYWSTRAEEYDRELVRRTLRRLENAAIYVVSADDVTLARFAHPVVEMALSGSLRDVIRDFWHNTRPYETYDQLSPRRDVPVYAHLYRAASRFLQQFDGPSLRDFLAIRAEFPPSLNELVEVYFMQPEPSGGAVPRPIVESARALGQWINYAAYRMARDETLPKDEREREALKAMAKQNPWPQPYQNWQTNLRKVKAKRLVEIEGLILSARSPAEVSGRVLRTVGQEVGDDAPLAAMAFLDSMNTGEAEGGLPLRTAQYLLLTYMRIKAAPPNTRATNGSGSTEEGASTADDEPAEDYEDPEVTYGTASQAEESAA